MRPHRVNINCIANGLIRYSASMMFRLFLFIYRESKDKSEDITKASELK